MTANELLKYIIKVVRITNINDLPCYAVMGNVTIVSISLKDKVGLVFHTARKHGISLEKMKDKQDILFEIYKQIKNTYNIL